MKLLLLSPPFGDPTLPPLGCSTLAACVADTKRHVAFQTDLNVRLLNALVSKPTVETALAALCCRPADTLFDRIVSSAVRQSLPDSVEEAKSILRDGNRFYSPAHYRMATDAIELAYRLLNAAMFPWQLVGEFNGIRHADVDPVTAEDYAVEQQLFIEHSFNPVKLLLDEIIEESIRVYQPDLVGISQVYDSQAFTTRYIANYLKMNWPGLRIVAGGTSLTEHLDRLLVEPHSIWRAVFGNIDYLMPGEAERALVVLMDTLDGQGELAEVPNLVYLSPDTTECIYNRRTREPNLDTLPPPHFNRDELALYWSPTPIVTLAPTRGCYWDKCAFCAYGLREGERATAPYREMSPEVLSEHVAAVVKATGATHAIFAVDVIRPSAAERFAEEFLERGITLLWQAETRPEGTLLTENRLRTLYRGGLRHLSFGIESCAQEVLDSMDKGTKVSNFAPLLKAMDQEGIAADLMLFQGFPGETEAQLAETVRFLRDHEQLLHRPVTFGEFHLIDGCRVEREASRFSVVLDAIPAGSPFRPASYGWSHLKSQVPQGGEERAERQGRVPSSSDTDTSVSHIGIHIGRRPWVGATGAAHTFLYFADSGLASVRNYNKFIDTVRKLLYERVFLIPSQRNQGASV